MFLHLNLGKILLETHVSPEKYNSTGAGDHILTFSYSENIFSPFYAILEPFSGTTVTSKIFVNHSCDV
jgi:hypothetical protein